MTAPASAPALRIFAGTTEGRLLCEWASGSGIPALAYAATEYGGELLGELPGIEVHAGRLDEADMERELSGARIVVDATHPFATLASGNIRAASLAVGARCLRLARPAEALPKGVVSVASIACAARFLSENPVVRFSRREQGACSLHARRRFHGALLRACAPAARCYNEVH